MVKKFRDYFTLLSEKVCGVGIGGVVVVVGGGGGGDDDGGGGGC